MNVIVCVDDRLGMLFNKRRPSQDQVLRERLMRLCGGRPLFMNAYSAKQFASFPPEKFAVSEQVLSQAGEDDWCFAEDQHLLPWAAHIRQLVLCRWNRSYPGDFFLDLPLDGMHLVSAEEFPGSSHEKITLEVYEK